MANKGRKKYKKVNAGEKKKKTEGQVCKSEFL